MTLISLVYDNFNDNSIDSTLWTPGVGSTKQTETGGKLNTPAAASSAPTTMTMKRNYYDIRYGRLAVRFTRSGTTDSNVYTFFGLKDYLGYSHLDFWRSNDASVQNGTNDFGTGTATQMETTVGLGPSWVANSYLAWRYSDLSKTYFLDKSTDGVNWTNIYKYVCTTLGAFNPHRVYLHLGCTSYGTVTNFTPQWDDVTYFVDHTNLRMATKSSSGNVSTSPKVRVGGAWKRALPRVSMGGYWSQPAPH